jgi:plastocyanin
MMMLLLFVPAAVLAGCSEKIAKPPEMKAADTTAKAPKMAAGTTADKAAGPVQEIVIDNFTFSPATVTVAPGTRVVWVNHDDVPHTATSITKPKRFDSGALDTDAKYDHVFTEPGTYDYFCAVHPKMTGQIIVK